MFQRNEGHRQHSLFDSEQHLAPSLRKDLHTSWAETFYREVFGRIDEHLFADLYSTAHSRPSAPVNVLMGMEIIQSGFGWSYRELTNQVKKPMNPTPKRPLGVCASFEKQRLAKKEIAS